MSLNSLSTADLEAELARREKSQAKLAARRETLLRELADLDAEIVRLGGQGSGRAKGLRLAQSASANGSRTAKVDGRRNRAKNDVSLADAIALAMEVGAVVSPREAAELVLAHGFKTNSNRFNMQVSNTLARDPRFKRLERGQYERVK